MTIDKIKHYLGEHLFNHWSNVADNGNVEAIKKGRDHLDRELEAGTLDGHKYHVELIFLNYLLGEYSNRYKS